ncbi:MAG: hypothetical protein EHM19_07315 [Candidatus Latescibacterota bacterium]|nr:MAG: hypothetical protein EHM19_07315 [Candidatus Latescibacterota bacterium]
MIRLSKPLLVLVCVCLALRFAFFFVLAPWESDVLQSTVMRNDAPDYHRLATSLLAGDGYTRFGPDRPEALRFPLFPFFVAGIYRLAGPNPWAVFVVQVLMDCATCLMLFGVCRRHLSERQALAAAFFYAIDPALIRHCSELLTETVCVFLVVSAAFVFVPTGGRSPATFGRRRALVLGGVAGLATLSRPVCLFLPVVAGGYLLLSHRNRLRVGAVRCAIMFATVGLVLTPWIVRNKTVFGYASLSYASGYNLLWDVVVPMEMRHMKLGRAETQKALVAEADRLMVLEGVDPSRVSPFVWTGYWKRIALSRIGRDPIGFAGSWARGVVVTALGLGSARLAETLGLEVSGFYLRGHTSLSGAFRAFLGEKGKAELLLATALGGFLALSYLLVGLGILGGWNGPSRGVLLGFLGVAAYFILVPGPMGEARYRIPAIPFYLPAVGIGAMNTLDWVRRRFRRPDVLIGGQRGSP